MDDNGVKRDDDYWEKLVRDYDYDLAEEAWTNLTDMVIKKLKSKLVIFEDIFAIPIFQTHHVRPVTTGLDIFSLVWGGAILTVMIYAVGIIARDVWWKHKMAVRFVIVPICAQLVLSKYITYQSYLQFQPEHFMTKILAMLVLDVIIYLVHLIFRLEFHIFQSFFDFFQHGQTAAFAVEFGMMMNRTMGMALGTYSYLRCYVLGIDGWVFTYLFPSLIKKLHREKSAKSRHFLNVGTYTEFRIYREF